MATFLEEQNLKIPNHTHDGVDSPKIDFGNLDNSLSWNKHFYYFTFFESIDGYSKQGNAPTLNETGVILATAASLNSTSILLKTPQIQRMLDFGKPSRFRLGVEFGAASLSNMSAYFSYGTYGIGESYYGFEVSNGTLKGSSSNPNTTSSNAITLKTLTASTEYELEARFYPNKMIKFYVNGDFLGQVRNELPTGTNANLMEFYIKTTNTTAKTMTISYYELLQQR